MACSNEAEFSRKNTYSPIITIGSLTIDTVERIFGCFITGRSV